MKKRKTSILTKLGNDLKKSGVIKSFGTGENLTGDRNYQLNKWLDKINKQGHHIPSVYFEKTVYQGAYKDVKYYSYEMAGYTEAVTDEMIRNQIIPIIEKHFNPKRWVIVYKRYDLILSIHHRDDFDNINKYHGLIKNDD